VNYNVPSSYTVASAGPFLIEGKQIVASNPDCALKTDMYYYRPKNDTWEVITTDQEMQFYVSPSNRTINWWLNETFYREDLTDTFGPEVSIPGYVPPVLKIQVSFITYDKTNNDTRIYDNFTLSIHSNGETATQTCDFSATSIINGLDN
jgi:hypothetical protein